MEGLLVLEQLASEGKGSDGGVMPELLGPRMERWDWTLLQLLPPADDAATLPLVNDPPGVQDGYRTAAKERLDLSASKFLPALACEGDLAGAHNHKMI